MNNFKSFSTINHKTKKATLSIFPNCTKWPFEYELPSMSGKLLYNYPFDKEFNSRTVYSIRPLTSHSYNRAIQSLPKQKILIHGDYAKYQIKKNYAYTLKSLNIRGDLENTLKIRTLYIVTTKLSLTYFDTYVHCIEVDLPYLEVNKYPRRKIIQYLDNFKESEVDFNVPFVKLMKPIKGSEIFILFELSNYTNE